MSKMSVIARMGGKYELIQEIVSIIDDCKDNYCINTYAELCGGGARMLLNLPEGEFGHRIYNEINRGIYNIFKTLTDYRLTCEFLEEVEALGYSRKVFEQAKELINFDEKTYRQTGKYVLNDMDSAVYTYILSTQSRAANMQTYNPSREWGNQFVRLSKLLRIQEILEGVEMYNEDCLLLLQKFKKESKMLIYLDPPYLPSTMQSPKTYGEDSWTLEKHKELVRQLIDTQAKVILSGYDDGKTYTVLEQNGWTKLFLKRMKLRSSCQKTLKDEYVWVNFEISSYVKENITIKNYEEW